MKIYLSTLALAAALSCAVVGCQTAPATAAAPQQQAINAAQASYATLDQAILAADAAVKTGALKGQDASYALAGFLAAKAGLDTALAALKVTLPAVAASGAAK